MSNQIADIGDYFNQPKATATVGNLVTVISSNAVYLAGFIFAVLIFYAGFMMITGAGNKDPQKVAQGKNALTFAVVGFVIIFIAYWIVKIVGVVTGIKIL